VLVSKSTASLVDLTAADGGTFPLTAEEQVRRQYTRLLAQARPTAVNIEIDQHLRYISSLTPIHKTFFQHLIHLRISKIAFNTFLPLSHSTDCGTGPPSSITIHVEGHFWPLSIHHVCRPCTHEASRGAFSSCKLHSAICCCCRMLSRQLKHPSSAGTCQGIKL
jgi:hypothetical protein